MTSIEEPAGRWTHTYKLLDRAGPFAGETFEPDTPEAPKVNIKPRVSQKPFFFWLTRLNI